MKTLIIIPARAGSIRLKNKNKKIFLGKPLINHTIQFAKKINVTSNILLTTDDSEIFKIGKKNKILTPWLRPKKLSNSKSTSIEFTTHAISWFEKEKYKLDCIILFQPTSPFRKVKTFQSMINLFKKNKNSVATFVEKLRINKKVYYLNKNKLSKKKRNKLDKKVNVCGNIYINSVNNLRKYKKFVNKETTPFLVKTKKEAVDIDTKEEFNEAIKLTKNAKK